MFQRLPLVVTQLGTRVPVVIDPEKVVPQSRAGDQPGAAPLGRLHVLLRGVDERPLLALHEADDGEGDEAGEEDAPDGQVGGEAGRPERSGERGPEVGHREAEGEAGADLLHRRRDERVHCPAPARIERGAQRGP